MNKNKCVFFTYLGKETKFIKKLSKNTNINIPYRLQKYTKTSCIQRTGTYQQI